MARTNVGTVSVIVGANIRALNKGLRTAGRRIGGFAKSVGRSARRLALLGTAAVGAAAAIGGVMVRSQLRAIDQTAKLSQQIGATTENLTAMQLQAQLTGSSNEALASSLQRMNRRIGLAAQGTGEAADALERMGLTASEMTNMGADEQFEMIAQRISEVDDAGEQAALAFRVFGRQGQELLPMLRQGAAGMEEARREAERLGIAFSAADASRVEEANDAMTRLQSVITGVGRELTIAIAPVLTRVVNGIQNFVGIARQNFNALLNNIIRPAFGSVRQIFMNTWPTVVQMVVKNLRTMWGIVSSVFGAVWSVVSAVMPDSMNTTTGAIQGIIDGFLFLRQMVTRSLMAVEFAINNWRDVVELAAVNAAAQAVRFANQVTHFFTEVIPSTLRWFANNWRDIMTDVFNFTRTIFSNIAGNVVEIFKNLPGLIAGTTNWGDVWTPMAQGFEATLSEFPDIAEREVGGLERALTEEADAINQRVGRDFAEFFAEREREAEQVTDAISGMFSGLGSIDGPDMDVARQSGQQMAEGFNEQAEVGGEADMASLIRAGTAQAQRSVHQQLRRERMRDNRQQQQLRASQTTAEATQQIARRLQTGITLPVADL